MSAVDRKMLIMNAATQSFAQFGYKATTMDLVSKIANVGKGTIYTFFKTKEELFDEILNKALHELKDVLETGMKEGEPFFHNILRTLDALLEFRSDHELLVKLSQEVSDIGTIQALEGTQRVEALVREYLCRQIGAAIERREIKPCDPETVAFMLVRLYIALTTEWNKTNWNKSKKPLGKEEIKENFLLLVSDGLRQHVSNPL